MTTYSPAELAVVLHRTEKTVRRWLKKGMIPGTKIGRLWIIEEDALRRCLAPPRDIPGNPQRGHRYITDLGESDIYAGKRDAQST